MQLLWPDGTLVTVVLGGLCQHRENPLGLGSHLGGRGERPEGILRLPLQLHEGDLAQVPGSLYFLASTPTDVAFEFGQDHSPASSNG
jgi:hypothetical protein